MSYIVESYGSKGNKRSSFVPLSDEKEQLIIQYVPLVKYVVGRMSINLPPGMDRGDLVSIGCWGLIDAAIKYDESKGAKFKTYAMTRIRGSILDELRKQSLGGQALCRKAQMLEKAFKKVEIETGKPATEAQVAKELEISKEKVNKLIAEVNGSFLVSLDEKYSSDEDSESRIDSLVDSKSKNIEDVVAKNEQKEMLAGALNYLPEQERMVVSLYYYDELTLKEIAKILKVSESRISQIHSKAIIHLKTRLKKHIVND